jgi:hypothetical protein
MVQRNIHVSSFYVVKDTRPEMSKCPLGMLSDEKVQLEMGCSILTLNKLPSYRTRCRPNAPSLWERSGKKRIL